MDEQVKYESVPRRKWEQLEVSLAGGGPCRCAPGTPCERSPGSGVMRRGENPWPQQGDIGQHLAASPGQKLLGLGRVDLPAGRGRCAVFMTADYSAEAGALAGSTAGRIWGGGVLLLARDLPNICIFCSET